MFEKSLYDLIRGLRNHKGSEVAYVQHSLRECRNEIKGSDMDLKTTALLKIIYLEMFGHDMSWASFHVLEVMSSSKYAQKRVGYLAAAQSFRKDTEVLMLATNLLKKDVASSLPIFVSLPLLTVPHVITPALAQSLLLDISPRLTHSNPYVRKKTAAVLYRLALVYPESLRTAWPKIKDLLMDSEQDSSVTAAIVNIVCELGWRKPSDFLALAPRLFELLVESGNNWMAIKIIKLFATLTPLEPRLIRKLSAPLANLIQTTPAMSLLYECINGAIQGGILDGGDDTQDNDKFALLCVNKLRGMIVMEEDPNLKYVSLLAFTKITKSHPHLIIEQDDIVRACMEDPDISIRLKSHDLITRLVTGDNIISLVRQLMNQLIPAGSTLRHGTDAPAVINYESNDSDSNVLNDTNSQSSGVANMSGQGKLPAGYRVSVIHLILEICSRDTYATVPDFEWYLDVLVQLFKVAPRGFVEDDQASNVKGDLSRAYARQNVFDAIGRQIRNVAVRVEAVRLQAVLAAESLLDLCTAQQHHDRINGHDERNALYFAAWVIGEYADYARDPYKNLLRILRPNIQLLHHRTITCYLQAIPKVFSSWISRSISSWNSEQQTLTLLQLKHILDIVSPLQSHPDLEVQERAVESIELYRFAEQVITREVDRERQTPPLFTKTFTKLFSSSTLRPVAFSAQGRLQPPGHLDLRLPVNADLEKILLKMQVIHPRQDRPTEFSSIYHQPSNLHQEIVNAADSPATLNQLQEMTESQASASRVFDDDARKARQRLERLQSHDDDPFYIGSKTLSLEAGSTKLDAPTETYDHLDIESIPIMHLDLGPQISAPSLSHGLQKGTKTQKALITPDVTADVDISSDLSEHSARLQLSQPSVNRRNRSKKSLLEVDSSEIGRLSRLDGGEISTHGGSENGQAELEMSRAIAEVERLRLEMQRASERVQVADGTPTEGTLVKKKRRKPRRMQMSRRAMQANSPKAFDGVERHSPNESKRSKRRSEHAPEDGHKQL